MPRRRDVDKKIICFGDSNTYGYDPRSYNGDRLSEKIRWTGRLNAAPGLKAAEYGFNGRQIPAADAEFGELETILKNEAPFCCLAVMLGSNDALFMPAASPEAVGGRMDAFLTRVRRFPGMAGAQILVITPPRAELLGMSWRCGIISKLGAQYARVAARHDACFTEAGDLPLAFDGIHLAPEGHRILAEKIIDQLKLIFSDEK